MIHVKDSICQNKYHWSVFRSIEKKYVTKFGSYFLRLHWCAYSNACTNILYKQSSINQIKIQYLYLDWLQNQTTNQTKLRFAFNPLTFISCHLFTNHSPAHSVRSSKRINKMQINTLVDPLSCAFCVNHKIQTMRGHPQPPNWL